MTEVDLHEDDLACQVRDVVIDVELRSWSECLIEGVLEHPDGPAENVQHIVVSGGRCTKRREVSGR